MRKLLLLFALSLFVFTIAPHAFAKLGVGVATGKIVVDQILKPGVIYDLPPLSVINTGDEAATYKVNVAYHETQWEQKPDASWFTFKPNEFELKPGETQVVAMTINVPIKVTPGKYFAYLEGTPLQKSESGGTSIGIAAAAKLYLEIAPANIFAGIYYRLLSFWVKYLPWTNIVASLLVFFLLARYARSHFDFHITKKSSNE